MKPRVLMIAYACNPEGGGEHWLGWGWAEQAAKNYSVHLITTPNARVQVEKHAAHSGITPHFVGVPAGWGKISGWLGGAGSWLRKIVWQYRVVRLARTLHHKHHFALVHQTTFHTFRVPFLAATLDIPSVWGPVAGGESTPPGFGRYLGSAKFGEAARKFINRLWLGVPAIRASLFRAGTIFVSNRTTLNFLPAAVRDKCVVVSPNALRPEDEQLAPPVPKPARPEAPLRLLYVGNCVATRALPIVFDALLVAGLRDYKLTIVGSGPALASWKALVNKKNLSAHVEFTGQVTRDQLPGIYAAADALVFPALRDSGGSALLEAMSKGLPVICLDWGGPGEMVDDQSGVKIPVTTPEQTVAVLAAALARMKHEPEYGPALAARAYQRAQTLFRWEARGVLLQTHYERLLARR